MIFETHIYINDINLPVSKGSNRAIRAEITIYRRYFFFKAGNSITFFFLVQKTYKIIRLSSLTISILITCHVPSAATLTAVLLGYKGSAKAQKVAKKKSTT